MVNHYTRTGAAQYLGVSVQTIDAARHCGTLRAVREGATPLFAENELQRWNAWRLRRRSGIRTTAEGRTLYNGRAAAEYLGLTRQGLSWRKSQGKITPDVRRGRYEWYYKETLDAYVERGEHDE